MTNKHRERDAMYLSNEFINSQPGWSFDPLASAVDDGTRLVFLHARRNNFIKEWEHLLDAQVVLIALDCQCSYLLGKAKTINIEILLCCLAQACLLHRIFE